MATRNDVISTTSMPGQRTLKKGTYDATTKRDDLPVMTAQGHGALQKERGRFMQ